MDLTLPIDTVENISEAEFHEKYFIPQIPVILKGFTNNIPAGKKWSLDFFKSTMGHHKVPLYDNRNPNKGSAYSVPDLKMNFGEFIDEIRKDQDCNIRMFLFNLFKLNPELRTDFPCPPFAKGMAGKIGFMFFAGKNTTVRIHYDIDISNVFHTHFEGKKRVVLFSPHYNSLLYKLPFNTYSLINVDKPDYVKYPALRHVKGYDFVIGHGDTIFMPAGYWHYMTYLNGGFSVSYRKLAQTFSQRMEGAMNLTTRMWFDKTMNKLQGEKWLAKKELKAGLIAQRCLKMLDSKGNFASA
jgi:hypothetical protein